MSLYGRSNHVQCGEYTPQLSSYRTVFYCFTVRPSYLKDIASWHGIIFFLIGLYRIHTQTSQPTWTFFQLTTGCQVQPTISANIITTRPSSHIHSDVPLHFLHPHSQEQVLESHIEKNSWRSSLSSADFVESTHRDLTEQFNNAEASFRIPPTRSLGQRIYHQSAGERAPQQYPNFPSSAPLELDEATIRIPHPPSRHISSLEHLLAVIMSPGSRQTAKMHGLVGKPLL